MTDSNWPDLEDGETEIPLDSSEYGEKILRNVHPNHYVNGRITSQVFVPSVTDEGKRSTARGSRISAQEHLDEYRSLGRASVGVCSVRHRDVVEEAELRWVDDSAITATISAHAFIDFRVEDGQVPGPRGLKRLAKEVMKNVAWEAEGGANEN